MTNVHEQVGDLMQFEYGNALAAAAFERRIRADERRCCVAEVEKYAKEYIERWAKIVGEDRAKACALDIACMARELRHD